jgi:hypothetical protein
VQQHLLLEHKSLHKSLQDIDVKNGFRILGFRMENLMELFPIECNKGIDCAILWGPFLHYCSSFAMHVLVNCN